MQSYLQPYKIQRFVALQVYTARKKKTRNELAAEHQLVAQLWHKSATNRLVLLPQSEEDKLSYNTKNGVNWRKPMDYWLVTAAQYERLSWRDDELLKCTEQTRSYGWSSAQRWTSDFYNFYNNPFLSLGIFIQVKKKMSHWHLCYSIRTTMHR